MLNETPSASTKIVTALKVAALVTVLSTVVLAAEHRLTAVPHEQIVASESAAADPAAAPDVAAQQAAIDYFPARFPAPTGEPSEQPPTF